MTESTYRRILKLANTIWGGGEIDYIESYQSALRTNRWPSYEQLGWYLIDEIRMAMH